MTAMPSTHASQPMHGLQPMHHAGSPYAKAIKAACTIYDVAHPAHRTLSHLPRSAMQGREGWPHRPRSSVPRPC